MTRQSLFVFFMTFINFIAGTTGNKLWEFIRGILIESESAPSVVRYADNMIIFIRLYSAVSFFC